MSKEIEYWNPSKIVLAVLVVILGMAITAYYIINVQTKPQAARGPDIRIMNAGSKSSCEMFSGCVTDAWCELRNVGTEPALAHVTLSLSPSSKSGKGHSDKRSSYIEPAGKHEVRVRWPGKTSREDKVHCKVRTERIR